MEKICRLIADAAHIPSVNMAADEAMMLHQAEAASPAALRLYRWSRPCISVGRLRRQRRSRDGLFPDCGWATARGTLPMVRRPTGGGAVFHDEGGFTYSIVYREGCGFLPRGTLESYRRIHTGIVKALKSLGLETSLYMDSNAIGEEGRFAAQACFPVPVKFDIVCGGRKVAGAAQRRRHGVVLHQGEIRIDVDVWPGWSYNILRDAVIAGLREELRLKFVKGFFFKGEELLKEELLRDRQRYEVDSLALEEVSI